MRIISGGQTGVDQAALAAAQDCGLSCGGWCPPGRACESGVIPLRFPLRDTPRERSAKAEDVPRSQRTEWNVRDSEATLILQPSDQGLHDPGTRWAISCANSYERPVVVVDPWDAEAGKKITYWIKTANIQTLNVAGPSERTVPGIGRKVHQLLVKVFGNLSEEREFKFDRT